MKIDKNSYGTITIVYLIGAALIASMAICVRIPWIVWPVTVFTCLFCLWQTLFFRVPVRKREGDSHKVTSVADGDVVIIDEVYEKECLKCRCIQISVYMDFWDVHANFWPVDGEVTYYKYHPGKHLLAFKPKASEDNEHTCSCIRTADGKDVFFKQLAGTFARRIVCYSKPGLSVKSGDQCGIIKFGSRIDIFLPLDAEIKVKLGDKVRACETVLAVI